MEDRDTITLNPRREMTEKDTNSTGKKKQRRSQIACIHCNRRRARCDASTIGLPCSACTDLGLADCQFIQSKRRWNKNNVRRLSAALPIESPLSLQLGSPASTSHDATIPQPDMAVTDPPELNYGSDQSSPAESNESETWTKAANVVSVGNQAGDVSVAYLGATWLIPAAQQIFEGRKAAPLLGLQTISWNPSPPFAATFYTQMISAFFTTFHPIFPMIDRQDFDESLRVKTLSRLLLEAVLLAGVTHCKHQLLETAGFASRMEAIQFFYDKVSASLNAARKEETLVLIQCMFILQFYWLSPTDWKDTKFWLSAAIRQAQFLGLHKKMEVQKLETSKQSLCRRIWWSLYIRDRQCASAIGVPVLIQDEDCDIDEPSIDDMEKGMTLETKSSFLHLVKLMQEVRSILQTEFGPTNQRYDKDRKASSRQNIISAFERWQAEIAPELQSPTDASGIAVFHLHLSFYTQILIFNRSIAQHHDAAVSFIDVHALIASHAASMITTLSNQMTAEWGSEALPFNCVYSLFAAITVQIVEKTNRDIVDGLKDEQMLINLKCLRQLADRYPIAMWIGKLINKVIRVPDDTNMTFEAQEHFQNMSRSLVLGKPGCTLKDIAQSSRIQHTPESSRTSHIQGQNSPSKGRESQSHTLKLPALPIRVDFNDSDTTAAEMEDFLAASYAAVNLENEGQQFMDNWQAVYNQLELEKFF